MLNLVDRNVWLADLDMHDAVPICIVHADLRFRMRVGVTDQQVFSVAIKSESDSRMRYVQQFPWRPHARKQKSACSPFLTRRLDDNTVSSRQL